MQDVKLVLEAPDVFLAASVLISQKFYNGKGDRSAFIEQVLDTDPKKIPDLARKLKLSTSSEFYGNKIFNDKLCSSLNLKQQSIFQIWLHCTRRHGVVTLDQMIDFAPYQKEKLLLWDKFVDSDGKTTLNMAEYMEMRKKQAELKKVENAQKKQKAKKKI